jgi:poly(A) polymerase
MFNFNLIQKIKTKIFPFYKNSDLRFVFKKLQEGSSNQLISAMFVGGCVRKYLSNEVVDDIDIATSLTTDQIKEKFKDTKFNVIDTGLEHGTVTLVKNKLKLELTTLRKDIKTDGRHAEIEFTDDWLTDSERRDITINAIYLDINGKIYDYQGGVKDLKTNTVKFIGDPNTRIQEDYLRIIRFLRFAIQYDSNTESQTIEALKLNLNGIKNISKERVLDELFKILKLNNFNNILKHKNKKFIFSLIFPELININKIEKLKYFTESLNKNLILAILLLDDTNNHEYFCHKYKTSNKIKEELSLLVQLFNESRADKGFFTKNIIKNIYFYGTKIIKNLAILKYFDKSKNDLDDLDDLHKIIKKIEKSSIPKFPYDGSYLKKKGMKEGLIMGKTLQLIKNEWLNNEFRISEEVILKIIEDQDD